MESVGLPLLDEALVLGDTMTLHFLLSSSALFYDTQVVEKAVF
jgi:hypothetical protein